MGREVDNGTNHFLVKFYPILISITFLSKVWESEKQPKNTLKKAHEPSKLGKLEKRAKNSLKMAP